MRSLLLALFLGLMGFSLASCQSRTVPNCEIRVYVYDSLVAKGGLVESVFPEFEKIYSCKVTAVPVGDGVQLLTRLELDQKRGVSGAHLVMGFDQWLWPRIIPFTCRSCRKAVSPELTGRLSEADRIDLRFIPYDKGILTFISDEKKRVEAGLPFPTSWAQIASLNSGLKGRPFLIQDPRTSTPGLLLAAFIEQQGEALGGADRWWKNFRPKVLSIAGSWDQSYALFLKEEAPFVWSYMTSQAYHRLNGDPQGRYRAMTLEEGHPIQIEGITTLERSDWTLPMEEMVHKFYRFLLSESVQSKIAQSNWMSPVLDSKQFKISLPAAFLELPVPTKTWLVRPNEKDWKGVIERWEKSVAGQ